MKWERVQPNLLSVCMNEGAGKTDLPARPHIWALQPAAPTKTLIVAKHPMWLELRHPQNKYLYSFEKWGFERGGKAPTKEHTQKTGMNASIVPGFEILIHHIITPARKKTLISQRRGHVSMENQRILAHNRSVLRKGGWVKRIKGSA